MKQLHRWKLYFDKDLEESWLNQLAQQGWGMSSFCLGRYTFEPIEPGEYIYRVDLLPSDEEKKQEYFSLLREMGVEVIQQWGFWFFCRRRASEGPFELYSDAPSKASHYGRIARMFFLIALLEIVCCPLSDTRHPHRRRSDQHGCDGAAAFIGRQCSLRQGMRFQRKAKGQQK